MKLGQRLQVTTSSGRGGRESLPLALHREWRRQGIDGQLLGGQGTPLAERNTAEVLPVSRGYLGLARDVRTRLHAATSDQSVPILISHFTHDLPALRVALRGMSDVPLIVIKHVSPGAPKKDLVHRWAYRRVTRLLAVSNYIALKCARVYPIPSDRIAVWHPGVNVHRFAFDPGARERIRAGFGATDEHLILGYVGRVTPNKGLEELLGAYRTLSVEHNAARLWIVGGASSDERAYESGLRRLVESHGLDQSVRFCGHQNQVEEFLSAIDVFVTPSREEAFGLTTVEAMAAGRPVVGFRAGGTPEIVVDGKTGILADPDSKNGGGLSGSLRAMIEDPARRRSLGLASRERAVRVFSTEAMAARLEAEINACHR